MNKDQLIAKQQLEMEELKERIEEYQDTLKQIYYAMYNIGAPLNDNILNFNTKQLDYLSRRVGQVVAHGIDWSDEDE